MQKYALLIFFLRNIMGFLRAKYFFWKFNFCPFQWGVALYGTVNNNRDIIFLKLYGHKYSTSSPGLFP